VAFAVMLLGDKGGVMAKLHITVDHNVCVGNAMCEQFAPNVFQLNEERQSEAVNPEGNSLEEILEAAENCPVSAITVKNAETGEVLFP
jgi:ferredoxin